MRKGTTILIGLFMVGLPLANALQISPSSISKTINAGETLLVSITLKNDLNTTNTYTLASKDTSLVQLGLTSVELSPNEEVKFNAILYAPNEPGNYSTQIEINAGAWTIPVSIYVERTVVGYLEPTFSKLILQIEQGTEMERVISIRNQYPDRVELRDVIVQGDVVTTTEGITKPVGIEGELGWLAPGADLSIRANINTVDLDPGSYLVTVKFVYYYRGERRELPLNFEITVIKSLEPTVPEELKPIILSIDPTEPKPFDEVLATLKDEVGNLVEGLIRTIVYQNGQEVDRFTTNPFTVEPGKEYCLNGTAEGYESDSLCFIVELQELFLRFEPEEPQAGENVLIKLVDAEGNPVRGDLSVNGILYETGEAFTTLGEGAHRIYGEAPGYRPVNKTLKLIIPITFDFNGSLMAGEEQMGWFNKEVSWDIRFDGTVIEAGVGRKVSWIPKKEGTYSLYANGELFNTYSILSKPGLISGLMRKLTSPIPFVKNYWWILGVVAVIGFFIMQRRKVPAVPERRIGYMSYEPTGAVREVTRPIPRE